MLVSGHAAWQKASRVERVWKRGAFQARHTTLTSQPGSGTVLGSAGQSGPPPRPSGPVVGRGSVCPCMREVTRAHVLLPLTVPVGLSPPFHMGISPGLASTFLWGSGGEGEGEGQFFLLIGATPCPSLLPPCTSLGRVGPQQSSLWRSSRVLAESKQPQCKQESWE